jgi:hypothetical protein
MVKLSSIVRLRNDAFQIGGGFKVCNNSSMNSSKLQVKSALDSNKSPMVKAGFLERIELPKPHIFNLHIVDDKQDRLTVESSLVYHDNIHVYVGIVGRDTDLSNVHRVKEFMRSNPEHVRFVYNADASQIISLTQTDISHAYTNINDVGSSTEIKDGLDYKVVIYATPSNSTNISHKDLLKISQTHNKLDFTPPNVRRINIDLINSAV